MHLPLLYERHRFCWGSSTGVSDMFFPYAFNQTQFQTGCNSQYVPIRPWDPWFVPLEYGGGSLVGGTRIAVLNGALDPTTAIAVQQPDYDRELYVIGPVLLSAHGLDFAPPSPLDPPEMQTARLEELALCRLWIEQAKQEGIN